MHNFERGDKLLLLLHTVGRTDGRTDRRRHAKQETDPTEPTACVGPTNKQATTYSGFSMHETATAH